MTATLPKSTDARQTGLWMALLAAFLGWMFDGFEIGLVPLVARPALIELLGGDSPTVDKWIGIITESFLIGAATGGVLFGWLGDRIGRVRAMTLSVLTYTLFMGMCGFVESPMQMFWFRFVAALGMGGEWSLGVSLVMELWPDSKRGVLAGLIGAAANVGFLVIALIGLILAQITGSLQEWLVGTGVSSSTVEYLCGNQGWRLMMMIGAAPALLTFLIRLFVPESEKWQHAKAQGATSAWQTRDLLAVLVGAAGPWRWCTCLSRSSRHRSGGSAPSPASSLRASAIRILCCAISNARQAA
jgi:MFS family permease